MKADAIAVHFSAGWKRGSCRARETLLGIAVLCCTGATMSAAEVAGGDRIYSLRNPVPVSALRDLSTDRPDQTESPCTVDAGHFQLEMDVAKVAFDRDTSGGGDGRTRVASLAPLNLKVGVTGRIDLQLMIDPRIETRVEDRKTRQVVRTSGMGDVTTRLKINFWGNDGGRTALAVMPFVKWPLSASSVRNGETEGGVIVPLAVSLPAGWRLGAMTEVDFVSDGRGGYEREFLNSITFSRDFTAKLGGYVEFVAVTSRAPGFKWQGQFDFGFTYACRDDTQLDFGCNVGVTTSAPDYEPFVGISRRF